MNRQSDRRRRVTMKNLTTHKNKSRSMWARFGRIAAAVAFGGLLCALPLGPAQAARHGGGYHGGWGGYYGGPEYYTYGPDYYYGTPEPYAYYPPGEYGDYYPPSDGLN